MLIAQNNVMNFSSKRHQCHQNCCLNKPYFYVKNAPNTQQFSYISITHRERNYAIMHCHISRQLIRSFRQSVQQPTLCAASYWSACLAWLQHQWRWTHRWNDKQNCASAPVVTWPIRKSQSCILSAFPQWSLPAWRWGKSTHRGKWPVAQLHIIDPIILRNFV